MEPPLTDSEDNSDTSRVKWKGKGKKEDPSVTEHQNDENWIFNVNPGPVSRLVGAHLHAGWWEHDNSFRKMLFWELLYVELENRVYAGALAYNYYIWNHDGHNRLKSLKRGDRLNEFLRACPGLFLSIRICWRLLLRLWWKDTRGLNHGWCCTSSCSSCSSFLCTKIIVLWFGLQTNCPEYTGLENEWYLTWSYWTHESKCTIVYIEHQNCNPRHVSGLGNWLMSAVHPSS